MIARAALACNKGMVRITTTCGERPQVIRAPVAVLRLYSGMLNDMVVDDIITIGDADAGGDADGEPVVPANDRHEPEAVSAALRWAMGLHTLLAADVHVCAQVLGCGACPSAAFEPRSDTCYAC